MAETATVTSVKRALRISHAALDDEIGEEIDACIADLEICGVQDVTESDRAILAAIKLWCRAEHTDDPRMMQIYRERYDAMKATLQVAEGYGGAGDG